MIILSDGYSIIYEENKNKISIRLPPTEETAVGTYEQMVKRKIKLSTEELSLLLLIVKYVFKKGD